MQDAEFRDNIKIDQDMKKNYIKPCINGPIVTVAAAMLEPSIIDSYSDDDALIKENLNNGNNWEEF